MKKKNNTTLIVIVVVLLFIVLIGGISIKININVFDKEENNLSDEQIIENANQKFGYSYCKYNGDSLHGSEWWEKSANYIVTEYYCDICGKTKRWGDSNVPIMCPECSTLTHRCKICGGIIE